MHLLPFSCRTANSLILAAGLAVAAATVPARPIDLTSREVPFDYATSGKMTARSSPQTLQFAVDLHPDGEMKVHALQVSAESGARVLINGRPLNMDPLAREDGLLFRVGEAYLLSGLNQFRIERSADDAGSSWEGTRLFSLENSTEEIHFNQVFSDVPAAVAPPEHFSQSLYDVQWYDCTWIPDMTAARLSSGTQVMIGATSLDPALQTVALDFDNNGGALVLRGVDSGPGSPALSYSVDAANKWLLVTFPEPIPRGGEFQVRVVYDGTPRPTGRFGPPYVRSTHGSSSIPVVYTFSEPYGARQWWPCKDLPADKATTSVQRILVPAGQNWQVVSNGLLTARTSDGPYETWTWTNHHPICTYLVSMCISNYAYSRTVYTGLDGVTTMPIEHAIYPEMAPVEGNGAAGTLEVMNFFAQNFGEYPFLNEKYFTASHNSGSGMEHQTCSSMPDGDVFDGRQRRNVHELAHHWFGDKITCETFDHLWLNEGFATYCEAMWDEHRSGPYGYFDRVDNWSPSTSQPTVGPGSDNFSGSAIYQKGAYVLHMLRHVVGETTFSRILRNWANSPEHSYATAVSGDFEAIAEATSGRDLTTFFDQWLNHPTSSSDPSRPVYRFAGIAHSAAASSTLSLQLDQTQLPTRYMMPLDVEVVDEKGHGRILVADNTAASQLFAWNLGESVPCEIDLDPDGWVLKRLEFAINTCALAPGYAGTPYGYRLHASHGGATVTWSGGAGLPPELTLSPAGLISGTPALSGIYSVAVTANDGTQARTATLPFIVRDAPAPREIVVESRNSTGSGPASGGAYVESGTFFDTTSKSSAPGALGNGSRYSITPGSSASFRPAIPVSGLYNIYITCDDLESAPRNNANARWTINHDGKVINGTFRLHPYVPGLRNKWRLLVARVWFNAGGSSGASSITFTNLDGDGSGGNAQNRFAMDAVKFVHVQPSPASARMWNYD